MLDEMCGLELRSYQRPGSVGVMVVTESYRRWRCSTPRWPVGVGVTRCASPLLICPHQIP